MVIAAPNYPISQAANEVENALEQAKQKGRHRLTVLGHTLTWKDWQTINAEWQRLRTEDVTSAFLYSLLEYGEM